MFGGSGFQVSGFRLQGWGFILLGGCGLVRGRGVTVSGVPEIFINCYFGIAVSKGVKIQDLCFGGPHFWPHVAGFRVSPEFEGSGGYGSGCQVLGWQGVALQSFTD